MADVDVRATTEELLAQDQTVILRKVLLVLVGEINAVRAGLIPPLAALTAAEVVAKVKAQT